MEEAKRKQIEAQLYQLIAQAEKARKEKKTAVSVSGGTRVIRRRKGNPDFHVSGETA